MKTVGDDLTAQGYEFVAVNSELKKDPQFVVKKKTTHFYRGKGNCISRQPKGLRSRTLDKIKSHAEKYDATVCFAGVGFARADNYNLPLVKSQPYAINYEGLQDL